jgi:hypothetical protein
MWSVECGKSKNWTVDDADQGMEPGSKSIGHQIHRSGAGMRSHLHKVLDRLDGVLANTLGVVDFSLH